MILTFHRGDIDSSDVRALVDHHFGEMRAMSPPEACHVLPASDLRASTMTFWSARHDGELMGIGALKELSSDEGEIKSMRTSPQALGRGVGRAILNHIMAEARLRGYRRLRLETGNSRDFAAALRLYESEGFEPCEPFGGYRQTGFSRFYSIEL